MEFLKFTVLVIKYIKYMGETRFFGFLKKTVDLCKIGLSLTLIRIIDIEIIYRLV